MYVDTKKLDEILLSLMPNVNREKRAIFIVKRLDLRNMPENRYKFMLDGIIMLGNKTGLKLLDYFSELRKNGVKFKTSDIVFPTKKRGMSIISREKALNEYKNIKLKKAKNGIVESNNIEKENNIQEEDNIDNAKILSNSDIFKQLQEINENLKVIANAQTTTCDFIKTLVFALNGEVKK